MNLLLVQAIALRIAFIYHFIFSTLHFILFAAILRQLAESVCICIDSIVATIFSLEIVPIFTIESK